MRIALIKNGVVENVAEGGSDYTVPGFTSHVLPAGSPVGRGWTYDGATFFPPTPPPASTDVEELHATVVALALVILDAVNDLRQWDAGLKAAFAANATIAPLRTAVAALPNMPDRTRRQLLDAVRAKLNDGSVNG